MAIHQEITFGADGAKLFDVLTDGAAFAEATGAPASIDAQAGGSFSCFGDQIVGRFVEIVPGERIVQAWRVASWEPGIYSLVTFTFVGDGADTRVLLDQVGHPESAESDLDAGWGKMYWDQLKAYLR